jgi:hypothetical protein
VILKDVLDHPVEEIGALLGLSVPAVKAALHRGRSRLRELGDARPGALPAALPAALPGKSPAVARYIELFNARDWEGVRAMLAEDVRLDLVTRAQRAGRRDVSAYFTNYEAASDWFLVPAWVEGREVVGVVRPGADERAGYFVELTIEGDQIRRIKDFRYVPYILRDAAIVWGAGPNVPG